jgi:hypothetical protein
MKFICIVQTVKILQHIIINQCNYEIKESYFVVSYLNDVFIYWENTLNTTKSARIFWEKIILDILIEHVLIWVKHTSYRNSSRNRQHNRIPVKVRTKSKETISLFLSTREIKTEAFEDITLNSVLPNLNTLWKCNHIVQISGNYLVWQLRFKILHTCYVNCWQYLSNIELLDEHMNIL